MRAEDLRRLEGFNNDCLRCLLRCCRRVPYASLRQRCSLRALLSVLLQRHLRWFGHASRRTPGEIIRIHLPNSVVDLAETPGGQLKTWSRTIQEDLALLGGPRVYGLRRWNREWPSICIEMAQGRRAWSAIVRDAVNALEAGQFRPG